MTTVNLSIIMYQPAGGSQSHGEVPGRLTWAQHLSLPCCLLMDACFTVRFAARHSLMQSPYWVWVKFSTACLLCTLCVGEQLFLVLYCKRSQSNRMNSDSASLLFKETVRYCELEEVKRYVLIWWFSDCVFAVPAVKHADQLFLFLRFSPFPDFVATHLMSHRRLYCGSPSSSPATRHCHNTNRIVIRVRILIMLKVFNFSLKKVVASVHPLLLSTLHGC